MKKLISMIMAGALALALAAPALAAGTETAYSGVAASGSTINTQSNTMTVAASTNIPAIKLTMPKLDSKSAVIINPYNLTFTSKLNGTEIAASAGINSQIISPVFAIKNETQAPLTVTASVQGTVGGNLKLVNPAPSSDTTNWAAIDMTAEAIDNAAYLAAYPTSGTGTNNPFTGAAQTAKVLTSAQKIDGDDALSLAAATASTPTYVVFKFSGSANTAPKTPWSASDTLSVKVTWTFTPEQVSIPDPASNDASLAELTLTNATLGATFAADTTSYTATANNGASVTVAATAATGATITSMKFNGTDVASNTFSVVDGDTKDLVIVVTAADGTTTATYTVSITAS